MDRPVEAHASHGRTDRMASVGTSRAKLAPLTLGSPVAAIDERIAGRRMGLRAKGPPASEALAEIDGRYLSTEMTGGFIGRVFGLYAIEGDAAFDWFDYEEIE